MRLLHAIGIVLDIWECIRWNTSLVPLQRPSKHQSTNNHSSWVVLLIEYKLPITKHNQTWPINPYPQSGRKSERGPFFSIQSLSNYPHKSRYFSIGSCRDKLDPIRRNSLPRQTKAWKEQLEIKRRVRTSSPTNQIWYWVVWRIHQCQRLEEHLKCLLWQQ